MTQDQYQILTYGTLTVLFRHIILFYFILLSQLLYEIYGIIPTLNMRKIECEKINLHSILHNINGRIRI